MRIADAAIVHDPGAEAATPFRALCQWSATISGFDTIPRRRAGDALADAVASMISDTKDASARSVVRSLACFGKGAAFRRGERHGFVPPWAALIHGTAAQALGFEGNFAPAFNPATGTADDMLFHVGTGMRAMEKNLRNH